MPNRIEFSFLGAFRVSFQDAPLSGFISSKAQALLCYLVMNRGPHSRLELATLLWGESSDEAARISLRQALANLRDLLPNALVIERDRLAFNERVPYRLDVELLEKTAAEAEQRKSSPELPLPPYNPALYRGDFLAGFGVHNAITFDNWMQSENSRLKSLATDLLHLLAEQYGRRGRYREALAASARLLELDPWLEEAQRQRMQLLAWNGQLSAAAQQFETYRAALQHEYGISPAAETINLNKQLKQAQQRPAAHPYTAAEPQPRLPFTGREAELAWLMERWAATRRREGGLTLVAGEAGVGKTRLVQQVLQPIHRQGSVLLSGRCYEYNRAIPHQPINDALRYYIAGQPPGTILNFPISEPLDLKAVIAYAQQIWPDGVVLFLDDLQWADADTLDVLHYIVRHLAKRPSWFVGSYRLEETPPDHPLMRVIQSLEDEHKVHRLALRPLSEQAVISLSGSLLDESPAGSSPGLEAIPTKRLRIQLGQALYQKSEGNPFLLTELVSVLHERGIWQKLGDPQADFDLGELELPEVLSERAYEVTLHRVRRLDDTSYYLLTLAALFGQPFNHRLLAKAGDCPFETVEQAVGEWLEQRLVYQVGEMLQHAMEPRLDFAHDTIRAAVYESVPKHLRRLVHARLAAALETHEAGNVGRFVDLLAHHCDRAQDWPKALHYLKLAAEQAQAANAREQAMEHYQRALQILSEQHLRGAAYADLEFDLLAGLEKLYDLQGDRTRQGAILHNLAELAGLTGLTGAGTDILSRQVEISLRQAHFAEATGDYLAAEHAAQSAIALAEAANLPVQVACAHRWLAYALRRQGRLAEAQPLYQKAQRLAERAGAAEVLCDCLQGLANVARAQERFAEAIPLLEQSLAMCRQNGNQRNEADACDILGLVYQRLGDLPLANEHFFRSLDARRRIGDRRGMAITCHNLAQSFLTLKEYTAAEEYFKQGLLISRDTSDPHIEALIRQGLCQVACAQQDREAAQAHGWQSLLLLRRLGARPQARQVIRLLRQVSQL